MQHTDDLWTDLWNKNDVKNIYNTQNTNKLDLMRYFL